MTRRRDSHDAARPVRDDTLAHTIESSTPIRAALATLDVERIRHLPVVDDGVLVGIISDRDLRAWRQALLDEKGGEQNPLAQAALDAPVSKLMTCDVTTVAPETSVREAAAKLLRERVGALPVVDGGEVVGIVSTVDLLELLQELLEEPDLVS